MQAHSISTERVDLLSSYNEDLFLLAQLNLDYKGFFPFSLEAGHLASLFHIYKASAISEIEELTYDIPPNTSILG